MKTLFVLNSSGRQTRSITRHLTQRFAAGWKQQLPGSNILNRDVGQHSPPPVDEAWIAAAYQPPGDPMPAALQISEELIREILQADLLVLGVPMYNFGVPAPMKAWIDQIVRINRTVAFDPQLPNPYLPLVPPRPVVIITSAGDGAVHPGGALSHMNHLEPHLATVLGFIGLEELHFVRAGYDEFQDDRARRSLSGAEAEVDRLLNHFLPSGAAVPI